jgi:hypothetical protein
MLSKNVVKMFENKILVICLLSLCLYLSLQHKFRYVYSYYNFTRNIKFVGKN